MERILFDQDKNDLMKKYLEQTDIGTTKDITKIILKLYTSLKREIPNLVVNGFSSDYKTINHKQWIIFITLAIEKIDKFYNNYTGQEKLELLILLLIYIIILHLPIDPITKEYLIVYIKEFVPEIVDVIIKSSKKLLLVPIWKDIFFNTSLGLFSISSKVVINI